MPSNFKKDLKMTKKLAKSTRFFIRKQKAEIRKTAATKEEAETKIKALVSSAYRNK